MIEELPSRLIRLRPRDDTFYASQNRTVLATERNGFINNGPERGLFVYQTRLLSRYRYLLNGQSPMPVGLSNVNQNTWLGYYIITSPNEKNAEEGILGPAGIITQQTIELRLSRHIGDGMHEDVDLTNFTQQPVKLTLQLEVDADFADPSETKGKRLQQGDIKREWRADGDSAWELAFDYHAQHDYDSQGNKGTASIHRSLTLRIENAASDPSYQDGVLSFAVELAPQATWHVCVNAIPYIDGETMQPLYGCQSFGGTQNEHEARRKIFLIEATRFTAPTTSTLTPVVIGALEQAKQDLAALRLYNLDSDERAWTMAAGLPVYISLFGRDTLTTSWQAAIVSPHMMRGTLPVLARLQGTEVNDWRDEQPGKMLHDSYTAPLAALKFSPHDRYYGSITTSGFYPVVVSELWHWTGDKDQVRPFIDPALKALRWLDEYGDLDSDGFYEYLSHSEQGVKNQAWKDSDDAMVYEDGSQAKAPIATCEEQGFVYLAKLHLSEVLWWLDEKDEAKRLYHEAGELKKRFNEAFWMEDEGFFAMGLDPQKRQINSIGSNPGHCLATGLVDESLVLRTAGRFIADDLFTGWGIRTLSSKHPAYNPYSYHRGSVWPVEHGTFALAFLRYGLHKHVELICRAQFEAAALFDYYRLPELFAGHQRDRDHPFPALYPGANSPQAWSASAVFCFVQAMIGLYPYAPLNLLLIDPHLPEWFPEVTLHNLQIGKAVVTIRFYRSKDGESDYEVLDQRGTLHVVRQPSPWSLTASFAERLKDALTSLLPGK